MPTDRARWFTVAAGAGRAPVVVAVESRPAGPVDTSLLSTVEHRRCAELGPRRADEFARGRSLLRRLAARVLGVPARRLAIHAEARGRPRLAGIPAGVSVSHTDDYTAAAVWVDGDVGVDVEEPPGRLDPRLLRRCCHDWAAKLEALPARPRAAAFARVWTVQEACVKALGLGLGGRPWRIRVDPGARTGTWGPVRWSAWTGLAPVAVAVATHPAEVLGQPRVCPVPFDAVVEEP